MTAKGRTRSYPYWVLMLLLLTIDQVSKIWVKTHMVIGQEFQIFDWFRIYFIENNGMAYGMELGSKLLLTLFRIVAMILLTVIVGRMLRRRKYRVGLKLCMIAILAGGIGNIIDSVAYGVLFSDSVNSVATLLPEAGGYAPLFEGRVVDMLYFPLFHTTWPEWLPLIGGQDYTFFSPIFNFADSCITVGVICLMLFNLKAFSEAFDDFLAMFKKKRS